MPTKSSKTRDLVGHVVRSQERRERGQKDAVLRGVNILGLTFFPSVPVSIKTLSLSLSLSLPPTRSVGFLTHHSHCFYRGIKRSFWS